MHSRTQVNEPIRALDKSREHIGRQHVHGEYFRHAVLRLDTMRLLVADPGIVDHRIEPSEPVDLVGHGFHFFDGREVADDSGFRTWRPGYRLIGAFPVAAMQNYLVALLDQQLASHQAEPRR